MAISVPFRYEFFKHYDNHDSTQICARHLPEQVHSLLISSMPILQVGEWQEKPRTKLPHGIYLIHEESKLTILFSSQVQKRLNSGQIECSYSLTRFSYRERAPLDHVFVSSGLGSDEAAVQSSYLRLHGQLDEWNRL